MKRITIDLRTSANFGASCKLLEMLEDFRVRGYRVDIIAKDWSDGVKPNSGVIFDSNTGEYQKSESINLYDPSVHPEDFYQNLVLPTFDNVKYIRPKVKFGKYQRIVSMLKSLFFPTYFSHIDYVSMYMEPLERKRYHQQHVDHLFNSNFSLKSLMFYIYFFIQFNLSLKLKVCPDSVGFVYKLKADLVDDNVTKIIQEAADIQVPHVLISTNWDDNKKFEMLDDRLRGILDSPVEFNSLLEYVKELDRYALMGKVRIVLASKKAVDWGSFIESDFLDLRNFEEIGLTLSQAVYVTQKISNMTINWPSSYTIWMTQSKSALHLTWRDNKDTAKWTRNTLHQKPVTEALRNLGVKV